MDIEKLAIAEKSMRIAGKELREAWRMLKFHGMEPTARELADTVLDVETSADQIRDYLDALTPNVEVSGEAPQALSPAREAGDPRL